MQNLGIVTGFGSLSEEVVILAKNLADNYARFMIKPWLPLVLSDPGRAFNDMFRRSPRVTLLNPFHFSEIESELTAKNIRRIFFTGDFPRDRFLQAHIRQALGTLERIADQKCMTYFIATPKDLSHPVRYFLALSQLLKDLDIKPLLACEIFPQLNISAGCASLQHPPPEILGQLPQIIVQVGKQIELTAHERNRLSQAVIVDNGIVIESEAGGTNELIQRYGKRRMKRMMPFLLKPPSVEFHTALDQPTIGPATVEYCKAAGVRGIVVCAETTTIVNKLVTIQRLNDCGMFLYALPFNQLRDLYVLHFPNSWAKNASIGAPPPQDASLRLTGAKRRRLGTNPASQSPRTRGDM